MSELWIGNATRQIKDFSYRTLESTGVRSQMIQPGAQVRIAGSLSPEDVNYIVRQHVVYGLIPESDIDTTKEFAGLCYAVDKPVTRAKLIYLFDSNLGHLEQQGREIRESAAVAQSVLMQNTLVEQGREERINMLDISIQQEDHDPNDTVSQLSVGMKIPGVGEPLRPKVGKRGRRAA